MRRWLLGLTLSFGCAAVVVLNASGQQVQKAQAQVQVQGQKAAVARVMFPPNNFGNDNQRLTLPDAVVVGRVMGMEPVDVESTSAPNQAKTTYRVAVVQVNEALHGIKKESKMVRVAFVVSGANVVDPNNINNGGGIQIQIQPLPIRRPGFPGVPAVVNVNLEVGQDGLFMLTKHHKENFYVISSYNGFVNSQNNNNFDNEVNTVKQLCKVLGNVNAALKADEAQERFLAAAVLITKYRGNQIGVPMKQEPISAEESKQILKGLASADWTPGRFNARVPGPMELFNQLGITAADGYQLPVPVRNQQDITQAMQKWLDENTNKYIIKKLVADPNAKVQPGVIQPGIQIQPGVIQPGIQIQPGVIQPRPIKMQPRVQPGQVQPLPAPAPELPLEVQPIEVVPAQPQVLPEPRR